LKYSFSYKAINIGTYIFIGVVLSAHFAVACLLYYRGNITGAFGLGAFVLVAFIIVLFASMSRRPPAFGTWESFREKNKFREAEFPYIDIELQQSVFVFLRGKFSRIYSNMDTPVTYIADITIDSGQGRYSIMPGISFLAARGRYKISGHIFMAPENSRTDLLLESICEMSNDEFKKIAYHDVSVYYSDAADKDELHKIVPDYRQFCSGSVFFELTGPWLLVCSPGIPSEMDAVRMIRFFGM